MLSKISALHCLEVKMPFLFDVIYFHQLRTNLPELFLLDRVNNHVASKICLGLARRVDKYGYLLSGFPTPCIVGSRFSRRFSMSLFGPSVEEKPEDEHDDDDSGLVEWTLGSVWLDPKQCPRLDYC